MNYTDIPPMIGAKIAKTRPEQTILEHTEELLNAADILYQLEYIHGVELLDEEVSHLLKVSCKYHDYGKANLLFQNRISSESKFNPEKEIPHNILSLFFINPDSKDFDSNRISDKDLAYRIVADAVLMHHHRGEESEHEYILERKEDIENVLKEFSDYIFPLWTKSRLLKKICIMQQIMDENFNLIKGHLDYVIVKGLLNRCDYSASAGIPVEIKNDFLNQGLNDLLSKWKVENPDSDWNDMQKYAYDHQNDNLILIAQTGMGKTEAGLLWMGNHKGFFILPLRTAINAMYKRLGKDIIYNNIDQKLGLLHSETIDIYLESYKEDKDIDVVEYKEKTKKLCMPLTISTLDQLFDFVFKYCGYEMKLATLSYSKIVIDEIQMYGADLLAFLVYGCKCIHELGGKIMIMTATLAPFVKDLLCKKVFDEKVCIETFVNEKSVRHSLQVFESAISTDDILDKYLTNRVKQKSNKILVVCNTVKKAQELYDRIIGELDEENQKNVFLFHNKFTKQDKQERENAILEVGKTYDENHDLKMCDCIWISTSLVEASLDIDFDYLFTELSDLNGLFQRLGRANRKGIKSIGEPNCFIYTEIDGSIIKFKNSNNGFIDEQIYQLSKEAILSFGNGIISELDKMDLIEQYFTTENVCDSEYFQDFKKIYDYIESLVIGEKTKDGSKLRNIVSYKIIPQCIFDRNNVEITRAKEKLECKDTPYLEKLECKRLLEQFVVSVEPYVFKKLEGYQKHPYYNDIFILECGYDDRGFYVEKDTKKDQPLWW